MSAEVRHPARLLDRGECETLFRRLADHTPNPETELEYTSAFELLIAVVLSAQATDVSVNRVTRRLFPRANTPQALLAMGEAELTEAIKSIGLFRTKARNVIATCDALISRHGGEVPRDRASLEALPGVGRKTANVVLNTVFGEHTLAVDTHVFRVANRTYLARGKTVEAIEDQLMERVPADHLPDAHHLLILHGRYVCKARKPLCSDCLIHDLCPSRQDVFPAPPLDV